jgi:hypothetical protein
MEADKLEINSLPSEYQSDCYDEPQEQLHEKFTKVQRVIDTALPLLPTRIKDSMNSAKSDLEQVIQTYIEKFENFDFLSSDLSYDDF